MKQTKTKLLCLLLTVLMLLSSLTACGKEKTADSNLIKLGDYQLLYKKDLADTGEIVQELKRYSDVIADMDTNMMRLRDKIKEI